MFKKLFTRAKQQHTTCIAHAERPSLESLETRTLMAAGPRVTGVSADNRGVAVVSFDSNLNATTISRHSVEVFLAGADGHLGTSDDVKTAANVHWFDIGRRVVIKLASLPNGEGYRIKMWGTRIKGTNGRFLDGEFTGRLPSGNGVEGGNFEMQTKNDLSTRPVARFSTTAGTMNVTLFKDLTPRTVSNFLHYVVNGKYDNIFFTRAEAGFVIQGGGLGINTSNMITSISSFANVIGEPGVSNTRGRLSMALSGGPNTGSKEFFFNIANNTFLDNTSTGAGPFTAFGEVNNASGLAVMDAIASKGTIDFGSQGLNFPGTLTNKVPVNNVSTANAGLNPTRDLIVISRIAVLMKIGKI